MRDFSQGAFVEILLVLRFCLLQLIFGALYFIRHTAQRSGF